jgi:hypothetical protein
VYEIITGAFLIVYIIPIPGNNFTFKQLESGLKSLEKEEASIEKYNPFFFKRFSAQGPRLKLELFPGIGINSVKCS